MTVHNDTTSGDSEELQNPRRTFREALKAMIAKVAGRTGRVVDRPTVRPTTPPTNDTVAPRLAALQLQLDAALAGEAHDLEALTAEVWALTPLISTRDACAIVGKMTALQQRRTAELNSAIAFMEIIGTINDARRADDARAVSEIRAQLSGKGGNRGK